MLSLIICSRDSAKLISVKMNVAKTIGIPYEVIVIDNSQGEYGICQAYNVGAAKAQYEFLCFMHEDIDFKTKNWGNLVIYILNLPKCGVLGVAGSSYQPKAPAGWNSVGNYLGMNVIHTSNGSSKHDYINPRNERLTEVVTLDGLWLCCKKTVWQEFKFDSAVFPGFHFYDIDFCIRVANKYKNYITFNILIEHFSCGTFDKVWMHQALNFFKKRKKYLPFKTGHIKNSEQKYIDISIMHEFIRNMINQNFRKIDILFCLKECMIISPFNRDTLYLLKICILM